MSLTGRWAIAGTDLHQPYPCMCLGYRGCTRHCPCRGRADVGTMPALCCARREAETKQRQEGLE